ncbi:hypothetical protein [Arthrobacter sp. UYEF21]|uniref:hypothetical protein n=1 Tax=Arthrobacter sp. UYEF21 TaxID=1756364 RepID=UPI0033928B4E
MRRRRGLFASPRWRTSHGRRNRRRYAGRIELAHPRGGQPPCPRIKDPIVSSYNDALTTIFIWMVPLAVIAAVVLVFIKEKPLATAIEHDVLSESIAEGNILITADDEEATTASR